MDSKYYQHKDFYLCAYLLVQHCQLIKHERIGNSTTFTFLDTPELRQQISDYFNMRSYVEPIAYSSSIKMLKTLIHSNRLEVIPALTSFDKGLNNNEFSNKFGEKF